MQYALGLKGLKAGPPPSFAGRARVAAIHSVLKKRAVVARLTFPSPFDLSLRVKLFRQRKRKERKAKGEKKKREIEDEEKGRALAIHNSLLCRSARMPVHRR